jgi:hypothetical protein
MEPTVRSVADAVLPLLHPRVEAPRARQDPELDEAQARLTGAVLLRVQIAPVRERHHLGRAGRQPPVVAERVGVQESALHDEPWSRRWDIGRNEVICREIASRAGIRISRKLFGRCQ